MTEEQTQYILSSYPDKTKKEIASYLGVKVNSVDWELRKNGITKFKHEDWSQEDIRILSDMYPVSGSKPCAAVIGRSYKAVQKKAQELGIVREYTHSYIDGDGYLVTRASRNESAQRVHRLLMEAFLGRALTDDEVVHHIDLNKLNNEISNIKVMTRAEHARLHMELRVQDTRASLD